MNPDVTEYQIQKLLQSTITGQYFWNIVRRTFILVREYDEEELLMQQFQRRKIWKSV